MDLNNKYLKNSHVSVEVPYSLMYKSTFITCYQTTNLFNFFTYTQRLNVRRGKPATFMGKKENRVTDLLKKTCRSVACETGPLI